MGEEAKQEQAPAKAQPEENKAADEQNEEPPAPPPPPLPFVLLVDLHCVGCAKMIERSIMKIRGVEGVVIDMAQNQVTVNGIFEPQAICVQSGRKPREELKLIFITLIKINVNQENKPNT